MNPTPQAEETPTAQPSPEVFWTRSPPGYEPKPRAICIWPKSPILKRVATDVVDVNDGIRQLIADMFMTMWTAAGIGLAAPQVMESVRVIVIDTSSVAKEHGGRGIQIAMVNPVIVQATKKQAIFTEACLSIPGGFSGDVTRPFGVHVQFLDQDGKPRELVAEGLLADAIQHEMDHLNGVLFVEHLGPAKRSQAVKKGQKFGRMLKKRTRFMEERAKLDRHTAKVATQAAPA